MLIFKGFSVVGKPKKSKDEMHKELFLRKRSRKNMRNATNLLDFDFNLGTISESDSSGDETYLVPANKDRAKSMKSKKILDTFRIFKEHLW